MRLAGTKLTLASFHERQMSSKILDEASELGWNNMGKPSLFFVLSLRLAMWPGLERWVDEVFNFFEILSVELWIMPISLDRARIEGWAQRLWRKRLLPCSVRLVEMKTRLVKEEAVVHACAVDVLWLKTVVVSEWIISSLAVEVLDLPEANAKA